MVQRNFYTILGIDHDASESEIKKAYRRLAVKFHPDKNPGDKESESRFLEVSAAYEVLSDEKKRKHYNNSLYTSQSGIAWNIFDIYNKSFDGFKNLFTDVYNDFLGSYNKSEINKKRTGSNIKLKTNITIRQAAFGTKKTIEYDSLEKCRNCRGTGAKHEKDIVLCPSCRGAGIIDYEHGFFRVKRICRECEGDGTVITEVCADCKGNGRVRKTIRKSFKIPPSVENESWLVFPKKGNMGVRGAKRGNVHLYVNIEEDPFFKRDGNDIRCEVPISFTQAALGDEIPVQTLDGEKNIRIPSGTQSGEKIEIRGEGLIGKNNRRGSQFVKFIVVTPKKLSKKEKALLLELQSSGKE